MSILLVGLNHRTAPVEIREQLAFSREGVATALMLFRNRFPGAEAAIISTCNRVEILVASEDDSPTVNDVVSFLAQARDIPVNEFRTYLYQLTGEHACRHFFRVAGGLDSMVLGENQIVSQIKNAFAQASEQGTTGRVLNRLFHHGFETGKRIRSETQIGAGKLSVPSVAVDVARRIFDDFSNKRVLVVGAGEMAQLVCQYLRDADARSFTIVTRSLVNGKALADACDGVAVPYDQLDEQLVHADIIITATACPNPILTVERIKAAQSQRRGRLLFLIDLAVPRNIDPAVGKLDQVYVIDIDELGRTVEQNQKLRNGQTEQCENILDEEVDAFEEWLESSKINPLIERIVQDARDLRDAELQRLLNKCPALDANERKAIEQAFERLVGKFVHPAICTLRRHGASSAGYVEALHETAVKR
jgi:glutamyl-tRNA reductase